MENRSKWAKQTDKNLKAMGAGERTSKKVSTIRKSDGTSFRRKNANKYGAAEGGNDYTEKRVNRTDRFDLGGTADSAENGGANIGGTLGSSMMKKGGSTTKLKEIALPNSNLYLYGWGRDTNGNSVIKIGFPNRKGFTIQTNGILPFSNSIKNTSLSDLSENDIEKIEKEVVNYVTNYGSSNQKSIMKAYKNGGATKGEDFEKWLKENNIDVYKRTYYWVADDGKGDYRHVGTKAQVVKALKNEWKNKYANGGLANVPESFPETDAMSYATGGGVGNKTIEKRLEQLRKELRAERISYGELAELQSLAKYIDKNDVELLEAAGVPEFDEDEKHAQGGSTKGFEYSIGGL